MVLRVLVVLVGAAGWMLVPAAVDAHEGQGIARSTPSLTLVDPDGTVLDPDGGVLDPDGTVVDPDGTVLDPDGTVVDPDGGVVVPSGTVVVPDVIGSIYSDAKDVLVDARLSPVASGSDDDVVIAQSPAAGQEVKPRTQVVLTLAPPEPEPVSVPDVRGSTVADTAALLEKSGLVGVFVGPEDGVAVGQDPAAGTLVPAGTSVTISLAVLVRVPDVLERTRAEATVLVGAVGLEPVSSGADDDIVVDQDPDPGAVVELGSVVQLELATAPVTTTSVTETPSTPPITENPATATAVTPATVLPELITVPDLIGREFAEARALLDDAGLMTIGGGGAGDVVIGQAPGPGARVVRDTEVRVTVAPPIQEAGVIDVPAPPPFGSLWAWVGGGVVIVGALALTGGLASRPRGPRWLGSHVEVTTTLLDATVSTGQANTGQAHSQQSSTRQAGAQRDHAFEVVTRAGPGSLDLAERSSGHGSGDRHD